MAPTVKILPEHTVTFNEVMKEYETTKTGPGSYKPDFKLTEKRTDVGHVKIREPVHEQAD